MLGFEPSGGSSGWGAVSAEVRTGEEGAIPRLVASRLVVGGAWAAGATMRGRGADGADGAAGVAGPRLIVGLGFLSFLKNTRSASLADSGRSTGMRLMSHMIQSQTQRGISERSS